MALVSLSIPLTIHINKASDICAKLRLTNSDVDKLGPEFRSDWDRDFAPYPSRPAMLCGVVNGFLGDPSLVEPGQYFTLGAYTAYPYSHGSIHVTSADDVLHGYDFDAGFMNHPSDVKVQIWAYKFSREIARRLPYFTGELSMGHPEFPKGSKATIENGSQHCDSKIQDIEYSKEDDAAIEKWIRGNINTTWHSLGTCAMRPYDKKGVVDDKLNVYQTQGLKVVDLSMVPENVGANTNNTALVVGEKAAIIIESEL
jgi:alcohol oxidase